MSRRYNSSPPITFVACSGTALAFSGMSGVSVKKDKTQEEASVLYTLMLVILSMFKLFLCRKLLGFTTFSFPFGNEMIYEMSRED
jgi:hypothetical protein